MTAPRDPAAGATPAREETEVSADDVRVVAAFLRQKRDGAVREGRGVMLSWDDANGFALVLDAAANALAALRERDAAREDAARLDLVQRQRRAICRARALLSHIETAGDVRLAYDELAVGIDEPAADRCPANAEAATWLERLRERQRIDAARAATAEGRTP